MFQNLENHWLSRVFTLALGVLIAASAFKKEIPMRYGRSGPWIHRVTPFGRVCFFLIRMHARSLRADRNHRILVLFEIAKWLGVRGRFDHPPLPPANGTFVKLEIGTPFATHCPPGPPHHLPPRAPSAAQ